MDFMSWFDSFLSSNPNSTNYNFGGSGPTGNLSLNGFIPNSNQGSTIQTYNTGLSGIPNVNTGASNSWFSGSGVFSGDKGGGLEGLGGIGGIADILAGLGNAWNGFQQQKLAKKDLNFQKDAFNRTFANNNKVYNQNMEDVLRARSAQTGQNYDKVIAERRL
jgi:hypothetical protein